MKVTVMTDKIKSGRPHIYAEPARPVTMNLPLSVIEFLDDIARVEGKSRSMVAAEMLTDCKFSAIEQALEAKR